MADIEAPVQTVNPENYSFWARSITQPQADISGETRGKAVGGALSTLGKVIEEGAQTGYTGEAMNIKDELRNQYEPVRDEWVANLSKLDKLVNQNPNILKGSPEAPMDVPESIKQLPGMVDNLVSMRANGRISSVYPDMLARDAAKRERTMHPGFKDMIDDEMARYSQHDPANKVAQDLIADINAQSQAAKEARNKVETHLLSAVNGGVLTPKDYLLWKKGMFARDPDVNDTMALQKVYAKTALKYNAEATSAQNSAEESNLKIRGVRLQYKMNPYIQSDILHQMDTLAIELTDGNKVSMNDLITGIRSKKYQMDSGAMVQLDARYAQMENDIKNSWRKMFATPRKDGSSGMSDMGGPDAMENYLDKMTKPIRDARKLISDPESGLAFLPAKLTEATKRDVEHEYYKSDAFARVTGLMGIIRNNMGENSTIMQNYIDQLIGHSKEINSILQPAYEYAIGTGVTQTEVDKNGNPVPPRPGNVYTMKQKLEDDRLKFDNGVDAIPFHTQYFKNMRHFLIDEHKPIGQEQEVNIIKHMYDERNFDLIQNYTRSHLDKNGNLTEGGDTLLNTISDQKVLAKIAKDHPQDIPKFKKYFEREFGNLLLDDFSEMNKRASDDRIRMKFDTNDFAWSKEFTPAYTQQAGHAPHGLLGTGAEFKNLDEAFSRINLNLQSLKHLAEHSGEDPLGYILQVLTNSGLDPKILANSDTQAGQTIRALLMARENKTK